MRVIEKQSFLDVYTIWVELVFFLKYAYLGENTDMNGLATARYGPRGSMGGSWAYLGPKINQQRSAGIPLREISSVGTLGMGPG